MKKIYWCKLTDTDSEFVGSKIRVEGEKTNRNIEVKVIDEKNNEIKRYQDVKVDKHKISIIMNFQWEVVDYQGVEKDKVEYIMKKNDDSWKVEKGKQVIVVLKKDDFEKTWRKMHRELFREKFSSEIGVRKKISNTDMEYLISSSGEDGYRVDIYYNDGSSTNIEFSREKLEIEPDYFQNTKVSETNTITIKYQEKSKNSSLNKFWVVFSVILTLIIVVLVFFWKKIWSWIKEESAQEKKIREQLDIF